MIGTVIGAYHIVELIGAGGMAEVYRAYEHSVDRFVAIKVMQPYLCDNEAFRARFEIEAKTIALLEHAAVLPIYAYGNQDGRLYIAMRYMPDGSLTQRVTRDGPLPLKTASAWLTDMASALDYAHEKGILHRDLKSDNVLLDQHDNPYLADFGLVKLLHESRGSTGPLVLGTPGFMSPEQCLGETELTPALDQYSLGVVLYYMLTGQLPFEHSAPLTILHMQVTQPPPSPRALRPELSALAEQVIMRALAKQPDERFECCMALAEAFRRAIPTHPVKERFEEPLGSRIDSALERIQQRKQSG
jgi:serine/threonine-protein kinase